MIEIEPVPKRYAWGSHTGLQRLFRLGEGASGEGDGRPLAEMWFSGHAGSPSMLRMPVSDVSGIGASDPDVTEAGAYRLVGLDEAIRSDPDGMVGPASSRTFGPVLPYLFKVIAARIPLSLQVHPVDFRARAGFNREQAAGIPQDAPERSFRDALAKHEMVVALEPFEAAVGFMPLDETRGVLETVDHPVARLMLAALRGDATSATDAADRMMPPAALTWPISHKALFRAFHAAVTAPAASGDGIAEALGRASARFGAPGADASRAAFALDDAARAAAAFPGDPSVLALLMMNPVRLEAGESVFIPAGTPHAYLHGMAAEIMTNSDNVLRAGMTPKHKDIGNLLLNLDCAPGAPIDPRSRMLGARIARDLVTYRPKLGEYMLAYGHVGEATPWTLLRRLAERYGWHGAWPDPHRLPGPDLLPQRIALPAHAPRVVLCCSGSVRVRDGEGARTLTRGQAVFVPARAGAVDVDGDGPGAFLLASTPF
ncbi:mannose-6-phosphate isomerase [Bifidobacterium sp. DSM 109958]|uniref:Mannose-6-phosphate isomerase n=1 Tax=Bifidobacterium moraviense TaxID=2675323 RepID=A0A7Y0F136_9BIFI|nr:mannose-6-phosphate isomerase [Bifidobacterium sp. DSM 109958]